MTTRVGIIGWPLEHSLSPAMHNAAFQALGMDWHYDAMAIPPDIVRLGLKEPMQHGYIGINVTIPHKRAVMPYVRADEIARAIGAVNTVDFRDNSGTNTDVAGFIDDLKANSIVLAGRRVVVLGAGGAARAAVYGLAREGATISVVNRTMETANTMLADLSLTMPGMAAQTRTLDEVAEDPIDLIVNATSVGMYPNDNESPWIEGIPFPRGVTVYDMIYRPARTKLMQQAEQYGGQAFNGTGMLVRQGAVAFEKWTGVQAPVEVMFQALHAALGA
jgi:shikimate dehydrogenase